jgi:acyl-coenzyme A synthetase/AMP-(fatty) acid ligase
LTSGSTGTPQVFDKSALQLMTEAEQLSLLLRLDATSTVTSTTAAHHLYGFLFGILAPYFGGASVVCDEANEPGVFHPHRLADLVERTNTTHLVTVPAHLSALVSARPNMSQLSTIVSSAAALDSELAKAAESILKVELIDVFGSTETGGIATRRRARTAEWTPLPGVECAIDSEQHLIIRSPYADTCPMVTSERVRQRPGGRFEYLGRGDGVVKIGGKRVSLSELEARAMEISGVRDARAIAKSVERMRGTEIWLALEGEIDRRSVLACLRRCLDPVFLPRRIRILPRLPRDERGKLKRSDLLRLFESES